MRMTGFDRLHPAFRSRRITMMESEALTVTGHHALTWWARPSDASRIPHDERARTYAPSQWQRDGRGWRLD
jgi:hypothetical protein